MQWRHLGRYEVSLGFCAFSKRTAERSTAHLAVVVLGLRGGVVGVVELPRRLPRRAPIGRLLLLGEALLEEGRVLGSRRRPELVRLKNHQVDAERIVQSVTSNGSSTFRAARQNFDGRVVGLLVVHLCLYRGPQDIFGG